jgi:Fe-S-cluster containining protein
MYASRPEWTERHPYRPAGLPDELIREIDDHFLGLRRGQEPLEKCLWFDAATRRCRHYDWRPQVCQDYELGGDACLILRKERLLRDAVQVSPGANQKLVADDRR